MGFFDIFTGNRTDINTELEKCLAQGGILLDVRTKEEYNESHIPGSINIPLQQIEEAKKRIPSQDKALFLYCQSGSRSRQAALRLKSAGYTNVTNIGGMVNYHGPVEKGYSK